MIYKEKMALEQFNVSVFANYIDFLGAVHDGGGAADAARVLSHRRLQLGGGLGGTERRGRLCVRGRPTNFLWFNTENKNQSKFQNQM